MFHVCTCLTTDPHCVGFAAMFTKCFRLFDHSGQDTNAAIEGYHTALKMMIKAEKQLLLGRRADFLTDQLTGPYLSDQQHRMLAKLAGFVPNSKEERHVVSALEQVTVHDL